MIYQHVKNRTADLFTRWLELIVLYCHGLVKFSGAVHYCLLFDFELFLQSRFDRDWNQLLMIDWPFIANWLRLLPYVIAWIEWCFFRLWHLFHAGYNWNSRLYILSLAIHQFCPVSICSAWNGHFTSVWIGRNRMETSLFFVLAATITACSACCAYALDLEWSQELH